MTGLPQGLPGVGRPGADAETAALAFTSALPLAGIACTPHLDGPVPAEYLGDAVAASFSGSSASLDLAVILVDRRGIDEAAGSASARIEDVLRPAFEAAGRGVSSGVLSEPVLGASGLFSRPESAVFDLVGPAGLVGWFVVVQSDADSAPAVSAAPPAAAQPDIRQRLRRIGGVQMTLSVEVGRTQIPVREVLDIQQGTVLTLDRQVGSPAEVHLNGRTIAHGEIVVVDGVFAVRITQVLDQADDA